MDERVPVIQFAKGVKPGEGSQETLTVRFVAEDGTEVLPTVVMSCPIGVETAVTAPGLESGLKRGPMKVKVVKPVKLDCREPYLGFLGGYAVVKLPEMPKYPMEIAVIYR